MAATEEQHLSRVRLDTLVSSLGLAASRARARDAIRRGHVRVDGQTVTKPSLNVFADADIRLDDPAAEFVSRAGLKLQAALDHTGVDASGREALDLGASTGGFTQVLLQAGAAHVIAVDVGQDQMHPMIAKDPRVTLVEGLNARAMTRDDIAGHRFDLLTCDVSFISLRLALPPALELAEAGTDALILVKPQFEAGRDAIAKNGLLRDPDSAPSVAADLRDWFAGVEGWRVVDMIASPIAGGDGNHEFLLAGRKT